MKTYFAYDTSKDSFVYMTENIGSFRSDELHKTFTNLQNICTIYFQFISIINL